MPTPTPDPDPRCSTCRWWNAIGPLAHDGVGHCQRYPPAPCPEPLKPGRFGEKIPLALWPVTAGYEYCGEYASVPGLQEPEGLDFHG